MREIYFSAPQIHRQGTILGSRTLRNAFRQGVTDLTDIGIPPSKIGIFLGFHTNPGQGGRERLKPASAWFNHVKLQVLAAKQVSREIPFATIWSWGWGEWSASDRDPDKPAAACVYLWTRDPGLCEGPALAGPGFDPRLTVGQLNVPPGAQCTTPWGPLRSSELAGVARVTGDREIAYTSLFARLVLKGYVKVKHKELRAAERAIVRFRFGGQRRGVSRRPRPRGRVPVDRARRDRGRAPAVADRTPLPGRGRLPAGRSGATARATRTRLRGSWRRRRASGGSAAAAGESRSRDWPRPPSSASRRIASRL